MMKSITVMRKAVFFVLATLALSSCSEDVTMNNPGFQGLKDDVLWRGSGAKATLTEGGGVTIEGARKFETLTIDLPSSNVGTYILGQNDSASATFVIKNGAEEYVYTTGTGNPEGGEVKITEYDTNAKTITGSFRFNSLIVDDNPLVTPVLNFQQGIIYKVPVY